MKHLTKVIIRFLIVSLPARGARIETKVLARMKSALFIAPRKGGAD